MLPTHEIESFLQRVSSDLQDIVLELRNIVVSVAPDAVEVIRWNGISYFHEGRGGIISAGICQIGIHDKTIRLDFIHGIHLCDPKQLLQGTQKSKRFVRIQSYDDAPWDDLKQLIAQASHFDPRSLQVN